MPLTYAAEQPSMTWAGAFLVSSRRRLRQDEGSGGALDFYSGAGGLSGGRLPDHHLIAAAKREPWGKIARS